MGTHFWWIYTQLVGVFFTEPYIFISCWSWCHKLLPISVHSILLFFLCIFFFIQVYWLVYTSHTDLVGKTQQLWSNVGMGHSLPYNIPLWPQLMVSWNDQEQTGPATPSTLLPKTLIWWSHKSYLDQQPSHLCHYLTSATMRYNWIVFLPRILEKKASKVSIRVWPLCYASLMPWKCVYVWLSTLYTKLCWHQPKLWDLHNPQGCWVVKPHITHSPTLLKYKNSTHTAVGLTAR